MRSPLKWITVQNVERDCEKIYEEMIDLRREMPDSRGARKEIEQEMMRKAGKEMRTEIEHLRKEIDKIKNEINAEFKKLKKELYELKKEETKYRIAQSAARKKR
jgi:hypothetical protein